MPRAPLAGLARAASRSGRLLWLGALLGATLDVWGGAAHAHDGSPLLSALAFRDGAEQSLFVGTTLGLLVTTDGGQRWSWICEDAVGMPAGVAPYAIAWRRDGALLVASAAGVAISFDAGCSWQASEGLRDVAALDLDAVGGDSAVVYVIGRGQDGGSALYRSDDGGLHFARRGLEAPFLSGLVVAPTRPKRLYVTGRGAAAEPLLFRSEDGGDTFLRLPHPVGSAGAVPLPLAASPADPDLLLTWIATTAGYAVHRTTDGGEHFTKVVEGPHVPRGAAFGADPRIVWLATSGGIYASSDGGGTFLRPRTGEERVCLTTRGDWLYACGDHYQDPWRIARAPERSGPWDPLLATFGDVAGLPTCAAEAPVSTRCREPWQTLRNQLGPLQDGGAPNDAAIDAARDAAGEAPAPERPSADAGAEVRADEAGANPAAKSEDRPDAPRDRAAPAAPPTRKGGCAVSPAGIPLPSAWWLPAAGLLLGLVRRRRR